MLQDLIIKKLKEFIKLQDIIKTDELYYKSKRRLKSRLKLQQEFINEVIADKKDKNEKIFWNYFKYQNPLFLAKDLLRAKKAKNEQLENNINDGLIDLRNANIRKEFPENEIPNKIVGIVEKVFDFNKQQKGK